MGGKQLTLALGSHPVISLADARKARDAAKALLAAGIDPDAERKRQKAIAKAWPATSREGRAKVTVGEVEQPSVLVKPLPGSDQVSGPTEENALAVTLASSH